MDMLAEPSAFTPARIETTSPGPVIPGDSADAEVGQLQQEAIGRDGRRPPLEQDVVAALQEDRLGGVDAPELVRSRAVRHLVADPARPAAERVVLDRVVEAADGQDHQPELAAVRVALGHRVPLEHGAVRRVQGEGARRERVGLRAEDGVVRDRPGAAEDLDRAPLQRAAGDRPAVLVVGPDQVDRLLAHVRCARYRPSWRAGPGGSNRSSRRRLAGRRSSCRRASGRRDSCCHWSRACRSRRD